jgi:hypothetical protein
MALNDTLHDIMYAFYKNPGAFSTKWLNGSGPPTGATGGRKGDYYIDTITNDIWYYNGTSWVKVGNINPAQDIYVRKSLYAGKGWLVSQTGAGAEPVGFAPGNPGDILVPDSTSSYGLKWVPNLNKDATPILKDALWWIDAKHCGSDRLTDLSGNGRDAVFGAGAAAPLVLPWDGEDYVSQYAAVSNYVAFTPSNAWTSSVTAEVDLDIDPAASNRSFYASGVSWAFGFGALNGKLYFVNTSGVQTQTSVAVPVGRHKIKFRWTATAYELWIDGVSAGTGTYAALTPPVTTAYVQAFGAGSVSKDKFYRSTLSIDDAAPVAVCDPSQHHTNYTKIANTGSAGGDWTINRAATGYKTAVVDRPLLLFGGSQSASTAAMSNTGPVVHTVMVASREFGTNDAVTRLILKVGTTLTNGFSLRQVASAATLQTTHYDTAGQVAAVSSIPTTTGQTVVAAVDPATGVVKGYLNGAYLKDSSNTRTTFPPIWHPNELIYLGSGGPCIEFLAAAIWDRALTDAEIAQASQDLLGVPHTEQPDPHPQYALESKVGNLLTENQASGTDALGTTEGFTATNATISSDTGWAARGTRSLLLTSTGTNGYITPINPATGNSRWPVSAGDTVTFQFVARSATVTRNARATLIWQTNGTYLTEKNADVVLSPSGGLASITAVAPAGANVAALRILLISTVVGESMAVDDLGFWVGAGGDWAMPGVPITNLGIRTNPTSGYVEAWNGTAWVKVEDQWETVATWSALPASSNWLGRKIKVSDGLGLCVAVWNGTAWVIAPESDTGWHEVPALINGWTKTEFKLRRRGASVQFRVQGLTGVATWVKPYTLPTGWVAETSNAPFGYLFREAAASGKIGWFDIITSSFASRGGFIDGTAWAANFLASPSGLYATSDPWPTTAPA